MEIENIKKIEDNENQVLRFHLENYKTKFCTEIQFEEYLEESEKKTYNKFLKSGCCCNSPLSLLIFSIFILAFTFVGFFFSISKNKGYKAYKGLLERNMSLIE